MKVKLIISSITLEKLYNDISDLKKESEIDEKDIALIQLIDLFSSHYESLEVLIKNNSYNSLTIISRVLFEIYIYIIYILENDSINRSKRFLIHSKNAQMNVLKDVYLENELGSKIRKEFNLNYNHIKKLVEKNKYFEMVEQNKNEYRKVLGNHRNWYNHNNKINSFFNLCEYLDEIVYYKILYQSWSLDVHGRGNKNFNIKKIDDKLAFLEIKYHEINDIEMIMHIIQILSMNLTRKVYKEYSLKKQLKLFEINLNLKL